MHTLAHLHGYLVRSLLQMRALYRNVLTASTSSTSISQPYPAPSFADICSSPSRTARADPPSFPLELLSPPSDDGGNRAGSSTEKSDEHLESTSETLVSTLPTTPPPLSPFHATDASTASGDAGASSDRFEQHAKAPSAWLDRFKDAQTLQGSMVSRSSNATLLSVTLTLILLSLLQIKKRHHRRKPRGHRGTTTAARRHYKTKHHRDELRAIDQLPSAQSSRSNTPTPMDSSDLTHSLTQSYSYYYHSSAGVVDRPDQQQPTSIQPHGIDNDPSVLLDLGSQPANVYGSNNVAWSLSDGDLPGKQDFVNAWLTSQSLAMNAPDTNEDAETPWSEAVHQTERQQQQQQVHSPSNTQSGPNVGAQQEENQVSHSIPSHLASRRSSSHLDHQHRQQQHPHQPHLQWQDQSHNQVQHQPRQHQHAHHRRSQHSDYQGHYYQPLSSAYAQYRHDATTSGRHSNVGSGHRKSLSLTDQFIPRQDLTPAEYARQEHRMRRQRYQLHLKQLQQQNQHYQVHGQEYQHHHASPTPHGQPLWGHHHGRAIEPERMGGSSIHDHGGYPSGHHLNKGRTANELAWERHCYYQQQQHQEEAVAEQKRKEIHWQVQQPQRQEPAEPDTLGRASSLNSVSQSSFTQQITREASLSRSKSASVSHSRSKSKTKDTVTLSPKLGPAKSIVTDCPILSAGRRVLRRINSKSTKASRTVVDNTERPDESTVDDTEDTLREQSSLEPAAAAAAAASQVQDSTTTPLTRKRTLKGIAPSIRSLARRCSSRFSNRPNSFAGSSSDPMVAIGGSDAEINQAPQSLIPGPDGIVDLKQVESRDNGGDKSVSLLQFETGNVANGNNSGNMFERVPIHRKVLLSRSKTTSVRSKTDTLSDDMTLSGSTTPSSTNATSTTTTTIMRAKSLSTRSRDSLRLANGRGFDVSFSKAQAVPQQQSRPIAATTGSLQDTERSKSDLDKALPETPIIHSKLDKEQEEAAKRQVMGLLAMGRKERVSAKTGQAIPVRPVTNTSGSGKQLSPLALEAQDTLPAQTSTTWDENRKPALDEDPCQRIAFMLVPKSRYEFQPLVMA